MSMIVPMRFSVDGDDLQPFHSSAYAQAAQGERLGAVSPQSYAERRRLERARQHVHHYGHSRLGRPAESLRPLAVQSRPGATTVRPVVRQQAPVQQRHTFHEPPARYNPYQ